jgi:predicted nucleic acid-binding protein
MAKIDEKFDAAISDTDILIDLFRSDTLQILDLLFHKIYIPEFIYEKELKKVVSRQNDISLEEIQFELEDKSGFFEIVYECGLDIDTKNIRKTLIQERKDLAGRGEVECACFAKAADINFVVSNNSTEFRFLNDIAVMLSYYHVLSICVFHNKIDKVTATTFYFFGNSLGRCFI